VIVTARAQQGGVVISMRISPDLPSYCVVSITTASSPRAISSWTTACFDQIAGNNDTLILTGNGGDNSAAQNYRGSYIINVVLSLQGSTCDAQAVPFTAT
jgi:hypothetical protein